MGFNRLLRIEHVMERTNLCRSAIYLLQRNGNFPRSITIGKRSARWSEQDIQQWIDQQVESNHSAIVSPQPSMSAMAQL
jgi:prophage regulatory protein